MAELNNFKGFGVRNLAISNNKIRKMIMYGCDGTNHAAWTATEYLDDDGKGGYVTSYAEDHGAKIIGKCTGVCKGRESMGGFLGDEHPLIKESL